MTFISAYIELFIRGECPDTQRNEPSRKQGSPNYYLGKCPLIDMNSAARCRYMIIIREPCGLLIDLCSLKHVITCKHGKNEDFNIFTKTSVKNYLFVCRKREYSSIVQYSLLYRQVTFFKHFHPDPPYSVLPKILTHKLFRYVTNLSLTLKIRTLNLKFYLFVTAMMDSLIARHINDRSMQITTFT